MVAAQFDKQNDLTEPLSVHLEAADAFSGVRRGSPTDDFAAQVVIAVVGLIAPAGAAGTALELIAQFSTGLEAREVVALVQGTNRVRDVVQLGIHCDSDFAEADHHADDQYGQDQREFRGNDSTALVIEQFHQHGENPELVCNSIERLKHWLN